MISEYSYLEGQRFERKFITDYSENQAEVLIKQIPGFFSEIYNQRFINNIYFDTPDLKFFSENVLGKDSRQKFRIRWYGDLFGEIIRPVLEVKIKSGLAGSKKSYILKPFIFQKNDKLESIKNSLAISELPYEIAEEMKSLWPQLTNRYKRKYFRSYNKIFRITLDSNIQYFNINKHHNSFINQIKDDSNRIIELKYDVENDNDAGFITNGFPFRLSKNSKYVNGIEQVKFLGSS